MNKRQQKLVFLGAVTVSIIIALSLYVRWQQDQANSLAAPDFEDGASEPLNIEPLGKTFMKPSHLGEVTYKKEGTNVKLYSSAYETLSTNCIGRPIAELALTQTRTSEDDIAVNGTFAYAHLTLHPTGQCAQASAQEQSYYKAVAKMVQTAQ